MFSRKSLLSPGHEIVARTLLDDRRSALIEAPSGYGKATISRSLARQGALVVETSADFGEIETLLGNGQYSSVVLSGKQVDARSIGAVTALLDRTTPIALLSRVVRPDVRDQMEALHPVEFEAADLVWRPDELRLLLARLELSQELDELMFARTDGWPLAVNRVAAALRHATDEDAFDVLSAPSRCAPLMDAVAELVLDLPPKVNEALSTLAGLERFTVRAADAMTHVGFVEEAVEAGLPLVSRGDGWYAVPSAIRENVPEIGVLSPEIARRIAPHLARSAGLLPSAMVLVRSGSPGPVEDLLAQATAIELDGTDQHGLLAALDVVRPLAQDPVRVDLMRARALQNLGQLGPYLALYRSIDLSLDEGDPRKLTVELELLRAEALQGTAIPIERIASLRARECEVRVSTQIDELEGICRSNMSEPLDVQAGAAMLGRTAQQWVVLGEPDRAAATYRILAGTALVHLGLLREAIDALDQAHVLGRRTLYDRTLTVVVRARLKSLAAHSASLEHDLATGASLADAIDLPWIQSYVSWARMWQALWAGRPAGVSDFAALTERQLGPLLSHSTGVMFLAEAASAHAIAGETRTASEYLGRAIDRRDEYPIEVDLAELTVAARNRDTARATALATRLAGDPLFPDSRWWRIEVELRNARLDHKPLRKRWPTASQLGLAELAAALSTTNGPSNGTAPFLTLFGGMRMSTAGSEVRLPPGHPSVLLALLAIQGSPVHVEHVIHVMWPEVSLVQGRGRLRKVVQRLRDVIGKHRVERSGELLRLTDIDIDVAAFEREVARADASTNDDRRASARAATAALEYYHGSLLSGYSFEFAAGQAERLASAANRMLEILVDAPSSERATCTWLFDVAVRIGVLDDGVFVAIGRHAIEEQNLTCARRCSRQAERIVEYLGVRRSPELTDLWALTSTAPTLQTDEPTAPDR